MARERIRGVRETLVSPSSSPSIEAVSDVSASKQKSQLPYELKVGLSRFSLEPSAEALAGDRRLQRRRRIATLSDQRPKI
jgi:hypothetical protein